MCYLLDADSASDSDSSNGDHDTTDAEQSDDGIQPSHSGETEHDSDDANLSDADMFMSSQSVDDHAIFTESNAHMFEQSSLVDVSDKPNLFVQTCSNVMGGSDRGDATVSNADWFKPSRSHVPGDNVCKSDRLRKACLLCGKWVLFLRRHIRSKVHHWTGSKAKAVIQQYGLRKQYTYKSMESAFKNKSRKSSLTDNTQKPFTDYHRYRRCPLPNCGSIVKRMSPHLTNVHKIQPKSRLLTHYLNKVRVAQCNALDEEDEISMEEEMETAIKEVATVQNGNVSTSSPAADDDDDDIEMESMSVVSHDEAVQDQRHSDQSVQQASSVFNFSSFRKWLTGPDGGRKDARSAQQHVMQVKKILGTVDDQQSNMELLLNKNCIAQRFLRSYVVEKKCQPGTIKSHLSSLNHFYDFWLLSCPTELPQNRENQLNTMKKTVSRWISSYRKDSNKRSLEKMDRDLQNLITSDDIKKFNRSQPALHAVKLLGNAVAGQNVPLSKEEYTTVHNYLLSEIILHNANQPGVLANMQVKDIRDAQMIKDHYVVSVSDHKTVTQSPSNGMAFISWSGDAMTGVLRAPNRKCVHTQFP